MQYKEELEIFRRISNELNIVFDVGTNVDIDYYNIKPNCEYHLFEPNEIFYKILIDKITKSYNPNKRVFINKFGLSNQNIKDAIYYENTQSFIEHWDGLSSYSGHKFDLMTLDKYVQDNKINKIDFLKIDCEELDFRILVGGLKTIKYDNIVDFLQIEYSFISPVIELLDNFDFYLMMEPILLNYMKGFIGDDQHKKFEDSLVKIDINLSRFIDLKITPSGNRGNLFAINKKKNYDVQKLIFNIYDNSYNDR